MMHLRGSGLSGTVEEIDLRLDLMTAAAYRFVYEVKNIEYHIVTII